MYQAIVSLVGLSPALIYYSPLGELKKIKSQNLKWYELDLQIGDHTED